MNSVCANGELCDNRCLRVKVTKHDGQGERVITVCDCAPVHLKVGLLVRLESLKKNLSRKA